MTPDDTDIPDETEIDSTASESEALDAEDDLRAVADPTADGPEELPERLSNTVPTRRAYGLERMVAGDPGGLLSLRERQYVQHADRLDPPERNAVEDVLTDRVDEFVETDWPVIRDSYPEVAAALRADLCAEESD